MAGKNLRHDCDVLTMHARIVLEGRDKHLDSAREMALTNENRDHRVIQLRDEWLDHLRVEFEQPYMDSLSAFLRAEKAAGKTIYPSGKNIFRALNTTVPDDVRVVILGQDPYHGPGQAHGLSFSVEKSCPIPPSLRNIFQELNHDLGLRISKHGCLSSWAEQGVLLLNTVLTVEASAPGSHQSKGWEQFTDRVIEVVNRVARPSVFMLWGAHAKKKGAMIDQGKHCVLFAPHPSPLSAHRGFLGCKHFSSANQFLQERGRKAVNWELPE